MEATSWPGWYCPVHALAIRDYSNRLVCPGGHTFSLKNGVPVFVSSSNYADGFGEQWKKHKRTQLDSYSHTTITSERASRCLGDEVWSNLAGKQVLECGCGAGRFTEVLLKQHAYVTSIDLSEAAQTNWQNFPNHQFHRVARADIRQIPFAPQQFDLVFCLGVIQHTPEPEATLAHLYKQVRPGGSLIIDHYTFNLSWFTKTAPLFRRYLRRLEPHKGMIFAERLVNHLLPLHTRVRHSRWRQMLLSRFSPVLCYYHSFPDLSDDLHKEWALLDTHDSLTDWYKHFRTKQQIRRTLQRLGLVDIWCEYGGNGVEARGRRPLERRCSSRSVAISAKSFRY